MSFEACTITDSQCKCQSCGTTGETVYKIWSNEYRKGVPELLCVKCARKKYSWFKIIDINDCDWFHGTFAKNVPLIQKNGFEITFEYRMQYTNGIYFLSDPTHPRIKSYGDTIVRACIKGRFIDASSEYDWWGFYRKYGKIHDAKQFQDAIRSDYPKVDGVKIEIGRGYMLVVWNVNVISKVRQMSDQ